MDNNFQISDNELFTINVRGSERFKKLNLYARQTGRTTMEVMHELIDRFEVPPVEKANPEVRWVEPLREGDYGSGLTNPTDYLFRKPYPTEGHFRQP